MLEVLLCVHLVKTETNAIIQNNQSTDVIFIELKKKKICNLKIMS